MSLLIFGLTLIFGVWEVKACDSYEECMNLAKSTVLKDNLTSEKMKWHKITENGEAYSQLILTAIAYKLDEISKKLPDIYELNGSPSDPNSKWVKRK